MEKTFLASLINLNQEITYYVLIIIILSLFLISVNFKLNSCINFVKILLNFIFKKKEKNSISNESLESLKIAEGSRDNEEVLIGTVDLLKAEKLRTVWGTFRDRRPELYRDLLNLDGS